MSKYADGENPHRMTKAELIKFADKLHRHAAKQNRFIGTLTGIIREQAWVINTKSFTDDGPIKTSVKELLEELKKLEPINDRWERVVALAQKVQESITQTQKQ